MILAKKVVKTYHIYRKNATKNQLNINKPSRHLPTDSGMDAGENGLDLEVLPLITDDLSEAFDKTMVSPDPSVETDVETLFESVQDVPVVPVPQELLFREGSSSSLVMLYDNNCGVKSTNVAVPNTDTIDLDDIQLYLECSDDSEILLNDTVSITNQAGVVDVTAMSQIKSESRFKISFPIVSNDDTKICKCKECKRTFVSKNFLRDHVLLEHLDTYNICTLCSYFTYSDNLFSKHMVAKHPGCAYTCNRHNNKSITPNVSMNSKAAPCVNDKMGNLALDSLPNVHKNSEQQTVTNQTPLDKCSPTSTSEELEHDVELTGSVNEPNVSSMIIIQYACEECEYVSHSSRLLGYHRNTVHNEARKLFKCSECSYTCKQRRSFQGHIQRHRKLLDWKCEACGRNYASKHLLTKHRRIHYAPKRKNTLDQEQISFNEQHHGTQLEVDQFNADENRSGLLSETTTENNITCTTSHHCKQDNCSFPTLKEVCVTTSKPNVSNSNDNVVPTKSPYITQPVTAFRNAEAQTDISSLKAKKKHKTTRETQSKKILKQESSDKSVCFKSNELNDKPISRKKMVKKYECTFTGCNRLFRDSFNLRQHMCTHTGAKQLACKLCLFTCVQKTSLVYHTRKYHHS